MIRADVRKAAVLLQSLPADAAAELMSRLSSEEAAVLSTHLAELGHVASDEQAAACRQFAAAVGGLAGTAGATAQPGTATEISSSDIATTDSEGECGVEPSSTARFEFLSRVDPQTLAALLADEHPQTMALVLSRIAAAQAAAALTNMPIAVQREVVRRVATIQRTDRAVVRDVAQALAERLHGCRAPDFDETDGIASVARILNASEQTTERRLLDHLAQDEPEMVEEIRRRRLPTAVTIRPGLARGEQRVA